jgi:hypothetical protein
MGIITTELTKGGYLYKTGSNWSTLENSTTATFVDISGVQTKAGSAYDGISLYELSRTYISFDTSPLIGASVSNITLNIYWENFSGGAKVIGLKSPKSLSTTLNTSHYDKTTFGSFYFDISTAATFSSITLSNDAINDAVTGELNIVIMDYLFDYSTSTFTTATESGKYIYYNTPGQYPYIEYTLSTSIGKINGTSNYDKVDGISSPFKINNIL